jgi:hypothetical protein
MDVEQWLDAYFARHGFQIEKTSAHQERVECLGDRIFTKNGKAQYIEYKSGIQTFYTGNIFLETVSVDSQNKPGWMFTCKADWIIYAALLNNIILFFYPPYLRENAEILRREFREVSTHNQNETYKTWGLVVPLEKAKKLATKIIELTPRMEKQLI